MICESNIIKPFTHWIILHLIKLLWSSKSKKLLECWSLVICATALLEMIISVLFCCQMTLTMFVEVVVLRYQHHGVRVSANWFNISVFNNYNIVWCQSVLWPSVRSHCSHLLLSTYCNLIVAPNLAIAICGVRKGIQH